MNLTVYWLINKCPRKNLSKILESGITESHDFYAIKYVRLYDIDTMLYSDCYCINARFYISY